MRKSSIIARLGAVLIICVLSAANGQPVTSIYGTDAQRDGSNGKVKERVERVTRFLESGKTADGMTETIRYDERGRRLYYFQTRLDVEKWIPTELRYSYAGSDGRVDDRDGSYDLLSFDGNGRLKEEARYLASGKPNGKRVFTYFQSGKPKKIERYGRDDSLIEAFTCAESEDGTLTGTSGTMKYAYDKAGVLRNRASFLNGKPFQNSTYDEYGNLALDQGGYCPESSAADARDIPTIVRASESRNARKDSKGRITERECVAFEVVGVTFFDEGARVVGERRFGDGQITSTRNTYADDGKIMKAETEVLGSQPDGAAPALSRETYVYDEKGLVKAKTENDGSGERTESYRYRGDGKLCQIVSDSRAEYYSYDGKGSLIAKTTAFKAADDRANSLDFSVFTSMETYSYYDDGKMKSQKSAVILASHDENNGMLDLADMLQTSKEFEYDSRGLCRAEKRVDADGNAVTVYYLHDSEGRLTNEISVTATSDGGRNYAEKEYAYERENGLVRRTERQNVVRARLKYAYDEKGNVVSCAESNLEFDGKAYAEVPKALTTYAYAYY